MSTRDGRPNAGLIALAGFALILLVVGSSWAIRACNIAQRATLDPVEHEIDRQNVEQSQAYQEGLRRDFDELLMAYAKAKTDDERSIILSTLRHRASGAPEGSIPQDVKDFLARHSN